MKNKLKSSAKRTFQRLVRRIRHWLLYIEPIPNEVPFDNTYPWLNLTFLELMSDELCAKKPTYVWGTIQGAALGKVLNIPRLSVIEFGVAGGVGLISLEHTAQLIEAKINIGIDVYGFDTGCGLPAPNDYWDQPNMWFEGQLPMNRDILEQELQNASLRIGLVRETVPQFLKEHPTPVAFVGFDLDLYSSTRDAMVLFSSDYQCLLPRVVCYFDDIMGHSYSDFTGERLAIREFNEAHATRKLSPIYGLRYFVPETFRQMMYWDCLYIAHFFDHPLYNKLDSLSKAVYTDHKGLVYREPIDSDWRSKIPL